MEFPVPSLILSTTLRKGSPPTGNFRFESVKYNVDKNQRIKQTLMETKARRAEMDVCVYDLKIIANKLSKAKSEKIDRMFLEAKWIYNYSLSLEDAFSCSSKIRSVPVMVFNPETQKCDISENREISMGSQILQSCVDQSKRNIVNLSKSRKAGLKIGKLKFSKEVKRIHLKQYRTTFDVKNKKVRIQGIGWIKTKGNQQIQGEIACADLVRRGDGYHVLVTCYKDKVDEERSGEVGVDLGIKDTVTLSDGRKFNVKFDYPERLKIEQKRLSRKVKGSRNYVKNVNRILKLHQRWSNQKDDAANKLVSKLKRFERVVFQDENIKGWQEEWFGKQVSMGILGRIKARLKRLATSEMVDRYEPTTKRCHKCGSNVDLSLNDRVFKCHCGYEEDRDIKAAQYMLERKNIRQFEPTGRRGLPSCSS